MAELRQSGRIDPRVTAGLLVLLTVVAYLPALTCGFIWDDDAHVTDSRPVQQVGGLSAIWFQPGSVKQYYPVTHSSFWLEYRVWKDWPAGYHAVNILLHAGCVLLLWRLLLRLELPGAWLAAALLAVHPVHVESVAWISERKNVLSGVFCLGAALMWLRWQAAAPRTAIRSWWFAFALFLAALLSKSVTAVLPAALLVIVWWKEGRLGKRELCGVVPLFALAFPMGLVTIWSEQRHIGAGRLDLGLEPVDRLLVAGRAVWFYAGQLAWPSRLTFIYPRWTIDARSLAAWLFPLGALTVIGLSWLVRPRVGRGPLTIVLLFAGTLVPALGFIDAYPMQFSFVADHFQYLASLAPLAGVGWLIVEKFKAGWVSLILVLLLAVLSWQQCGIYQDRFSLWIDTVKKNPDSKLAQTSLGNELGGLQPPQHKRAEACHRAAIKIDPEYGDAWNNLAVELQEQGRCDEALQAARRAVAVAPWLPKARVNLGRGLYERNKYDEAVRHLAEAVRLDDRYLDAWVVLAHAYHRLQDEQQVRECCRRVVGIDARAGRLLATKLAVEP